MAKPLLTDELWAQIEPLLPPAKPRRFRYPGRKPLDNRQALTGILFVLKSGIAWELLPQEMGCGSGMTCWRRLRDWQQAGVWQRLHESFLSQLDAQGELDWSRAAVDSSFARAWGGGEETGPNPTDRSKLGSKHHLLVEAHGIPLVAELSAANVPDQNRLIPLLAGLPDLSGTGQTHLPTEIYADRAYDSEPHRQLLRWLGLKPLLAKRRTAHGSGLGVYRWVVERTIAWLHSFGRLRFRRDRRADIHQAFLKFACALIAWNFLLASFC